MSGQFLTLIISTPTYVRMSTCFSAIIAVFVVFILFLVSKRQDNGQGGRRVGYIGSFLIKARSMQNQRYAPQFIHVYVSYEY